MPFIPFMILCLGAIFLWRKAPWLIISLLLMAGVWVIYIVSAARAKNEKIARIRIQLAKSKADFLTNVFGISQTDCEKLGFDGRFFLHDRDVPYEEYRGIHETGSSVIQVNDSNLPHVKSWKYQRVDGGPDLRFRDNTQTMTSEQHMITFDGQRPYQLSVFSYPGEGQAVSKLIQRFETFLIGAKVKNYEELFERYQSSHRDRLLAEGELSRLQREITECESVINAISKLAALAGVCDSPDAKIAVAAARREECLAKKDKIRQEVANLTIEENAAITEARKQCELAQLQDKIAKFS